MANRKLPSVKTLCARLGCDSTIAGAVRYVLSKDPRTDLEINDTLETVSVLIHGYGVEYVPSRQDTHGRGRGLEYVNMGDTYAATILYDCLHKRFVCGSWGDIVESQPERF